MRFDAFQWINLNKALWMLAGEAMEVLVWRTSMKLSSMYETSSLHFPAFEFDTAV